MPSNISRHDIMFSGNQSSPNVMLSCVFSFDMWLPNTYAQFAYAVSLSHILTYWQYRIIKQHLLSAGWQGDGKVVWHGTCIHINHISYFEILSCMHSAEEIYAMNIIHICTYIKEIEHYIFRLYNKWAYFNNYSLLFTFHIWYIWSYDRYWSRNSTGSACEYIWRR